MNNNISKSELMTAYNKARTALRRAGDVKAIERLNKAFGILQSKSYYNGDRVLYIPTATACGCKDWQYRLAAKRAYTGPCKHMIAEAMTAQIMQARGIDVTEFFEQLAEQRDAAEVYERD